MAACGHRADGQLGLALEEFPNAFYLLVDKPEVYGLPSNPKLPSRSVPRSAFWSIFTAFLTALGVLFTFRSRTKSEPAPRTPAGPNPNGGQL